MIFDSMFNVQRSMFDVHIFRSTLRLRASAREHVFGSVQMAASIQRNILCVE